MESNDKSSGGRVPFGDVTNTLGTQSSRSLDSREVKRQRDRERSKAMIEEQRDRVCCLHSFIWYFRI